MAQLPESAVNPRKIKLQGGIRGIFPQQGPEIICRRQILTLYHRLPGGFLQSKLFMPAVSGVKRNRQVVPRGCLRPGLKHGTGRHQRVNHGRPFNLGNGHLRPEARLLVSGHGNAPLPSQGRKAVRHRGVQKGVVYRHGLFPLMFRPENPRLEQDHVRSRCNVRQALCRRPGLGKTATIEEQLRKTHGSKFLLREIPDQPLPDLNGRTNLAIGLPSPGRERADRDGLGILARGHLRPRAQLHNQPLLFQSLQEIKDKTLVLDGLRQHSLKERLFRAALSLGAVNTQQKQICLGLAALASQRFGQSLGQLLGLGIQFVGEQQPGPQQISLPAQQWQRRQQPLPRFVRQLSDQLFQNLHRLPGFAFSRQQPDPQQPDIMGFFRRDSGLPGSLALLCGHLPKPDPSLGKTLLLKGQLKQAAHNLLILRLAKIGLPQSLLRFMGQAALPIHLGQAQKRSASQLPVRLMRCKYSGIILPGFGIGRGLGQSLGNEQPGLRRFAQLGEFLL